MNYSDIRQKSKCFTGGGAKSTFGQTNCAPDYHSFVVRVARGELQDVMREKMMRAEEKRLIDDLPGLQSGRNRGKKCNMSFARAMYGT